MSYVEDRAAQQRAELARAIMAELAKLAPDAKVTWPARRPDWDVDTKSLSTTRFNEFPDEIEVAHTDRSVTIRLSNMGRFWTSDACGTVPGVGSLRALTNGSAPSLARRALAHIDEQHQAALRRQIEDEQRRTDRQRREASSAAIHAACPDAAQGMLSIGPLLLTVDPQATALPAGYVEIRGRLAPAQIAALVEAVRAVAVQSATPD